MIVEEDWEDFEIHEYRTYKFYDIENIINFIKVLKMNDIQEVHRFKSIPSIHIKRYKKIINDLPICVIVFSDYYYIMEFEKYEKSHLYHGCPLIEENENITK